MSTVEVMVDSWELECCGGPLQVGDRVEWGLLFLPGPALGRPVEDLWSVEELPGPGPGWSARLLTAGPLRATWVGTGPLPPPGMHRLTGHLCCTWHGGPLEDELATTSARISRLRLVEQRYERETGPSGDVHVPAVDGATFRDVDSAPDGLREQDAAEGAVSYRADSGWLVDLQLDRPTSGG